MIRRGPRQRAWWSSPVPVLIITAVCSASLSPQASAQVIELQGGSSSLFDAHGGSATIRGGTYTLAFGAGVLSDEITVGFLAKRSLRRFAFSFGDEAVDFELPTDVFGGSRYVPVRGAGMEWTGRASHARILVGTTSQTLGAPFFRGAVSGRPVGLLFFDRRISQRWRVFSKTALAARPTSIHGVMWQAAAFLNTAFAAGIGNDRPYFASSAVLERRWMEARAGYVHQKAGFRRLEANSPTAAEPARENVTVTLRPAEWWSATVGRQTLMDIQESTSDGRRVTVNQLGGSVNSAGFRFVAALYDSHQPRVNNRGLSISAGRRITRSVDLVLDYFRNDPSNDRASRSVVLRVQEALTPRISLMQAVTRSANQTSLNFGGELLTNPVRAGVSYQTVYAPLKEGNPFVHVMGVDARFSLFDRVELQVGTYTTPTGQLRYLVSGTCGHSISKGAGNGGKPIAFQRFIVEGVVQDENQAPIAGAVLQFGQEVVVTNTEGRFFLRTARADRVGLRVVTSEFLSPGRYAVVSAPTTVTPAKSENSVPVIITLRRV